MTDNPLILARHMAGVAIATACLGMAAGGAVVYELVPTREPAACREVREVTDEYLTTQSNLLSAVTERANAVDWIGKQRADDKVDVLVAELEPLTATYDREFAECEAAS